MSGASRQTDPDDDARSRRALGATFARGAERYERLRPGYPQAAVPWLLGEAPRRVADVGAGTGKLTAALLNAGHDVVAVDPSADMLAQLRQRLPGVTALVGTGERTGLHEAAAPVDPTRPAGPEANVAPVEAIVYGQAWHWVEPVAGSAEAARVLPPGGVLGLLWNVMDLEVPWVADLNTAMHSAETAPVQARSDTAALVAAPFRLEARVDIPFTVATTAGELAGLVTTRSYYLAMDADGRAELADRARRQVEGTFGDDPRRVAELPYVTQCFRFVRDSIAGRTPLTALQAPAKGS